MNIFTIRSAEESDKAVGMMIHAHQYLKLCRTSGAVVEAEAKIRLLFKLLFIIIWTARHSRVDECVFVLNLMTLRVVVDDTTANKYIIICPAERSTFKLKEIWILLETEETTVKGWHIWIWLSRECILDFSFDVSVVAADVETVGPTVDPIIMFDGNRNSNEFIRNDWWIRGSWFSAKTCGE